MTFTEYEKAVRGESFRWEYLNEEQRYAVWSFHIATGGPEIGYEEFSDHIDGQLELN